MNSKPFIPANTRILANTRALVAAVTFGLGCAPAVAALVDIAPQPLANSASALVKPNLMFILDDSGSMNGAHMPDYVDSEPHCRRNGTTLTACSFGTPPFNSAQYNTLFYNPTITYLPPTRYDGTLYPSNDTALLWAAVPNDGFGIQFTGTSNLLISYPDLVYCTTSSPTVANRTPPFTNATVCRRPIQGGAWTYPNATASNQISIFGNPYYYTITGITWCSNRDGIAGFGLAPCQAKKTPTFQYPRYGSLGVNGFTRVDIVPTTATYPRVISRIDCTGAVGATGCSYNEEMTNFANWYAYYRTRMQMMKSAAGHAFRAIDDTFRVGFITINPGSPVTSAKYLPIADFTAGATGHKSAWYARFYAQDPNNSTPLREALARVGRHFAGRTDQINTGMNDNPMQYSCQENYAILSTDGFWNGNAGKQLNGTTDIANHDNVPELTTESPDNYTTSRRPLFDGSALTTTFVSTPTLTQVVCTDNASTFAGGTTCGCTAGSNFKRVKQRTVTANANVSARDGVTISTTAAPTSTTYQDITACNATVVVTTTPFTVVAQQKLAGGVMSTFPIIGGVSAGANQAGSCASVGFANLKTRTTTYNTVVETRDGVTFSTVVGTPTYSFSDSACVSATTVQVFAVLETQQYVSGEHLSGASDPTAYSAAANASNVQSTFACSGAGIRTVRLQRITPYNRTVTTTGGVVTGNVLSANTGAPSFSATSPCDTSAKTAIPPSAQAQTLTSTTITAGGGPAPAATTTTPGVPSATTSGASITALNFTVTAGGPQVMPSTSNITSTVYGYANTLADVAQYYYMTDLRAPGSLGTPVGTPAVARDVGTLNDVPRPASSDPQDDTANHQHMTTFTLGLGVDGALTYDPDYRVTPAGDFAQIIAGTLPWPQPVANSETATDDLWHAAVNGRGKYFSAKDPAALSAGLTEALSTLDAVIGAGAAAATSRLEPVPGDNFFYIASYETETWAGEVESFEFDLTTRTLASVATWTAQSQLDAVVNSTTPGGQGRDIKRFNPLTGTKLEAFNWANLSATGDDAYFSTVWIGGGALALSQWAILNATQRTLAAGSNLVNFIRGDDANERSTSNTAGVYRNRVSALGDVANAAPAYVRTATRDYGDSGYQAYKACVNAAGATCGGIYDGPREADGNRVSTVYVGANDGMLHAFDGDTGSERWAYIPGILIPKLYLLADLNYADRHAFFADGSPVTGDVYDPIDAKWKTILVAGLNGGGRGYYALDITNPAAPRGLWEFGVKPVASCPDPVVLDVDTSDCDLGFTYGNPIITKLGNGEWVVMATSGYNNVSPGDGKGYLYVLDPMTGVIKKKILAANPSQGINPGDTTTPTNLAKISARVTLASVNQTALHVYGGDMLGNLWRFNADLDTARVIAELTDPSGDPQPVTTRPDLTTVRVQPGNVRVPMVYVATGRYLGLGDLGSVQTQTIYGIKDATVDDLAAAPAPIDARGTTVVSQTLTNTTAGGNQVRTITANPVDLLTQNGWRIDLPDAGERVNLDPELILGSLLVVSNVPTNTACAPGGYRWRNLIDYRTGGVVPGSAYAGLYGSALGVGISVVWIEGVPYASILDFRKGTETGEVDIAGQTPTGRRSSWRELIE